MTSQDGPEAFFQASDLVLHEFRKLFGAFVGLALTRVTFPLEEIYTVPLQQP